MGRFIATVLLTVLIATVFYSCGSGNGTDTEIVIQSNVDEAVSDQFKQVFDQYLLLKDALVESQPEGAKAHLEGLQLAIDAVDEAAINEEDQLRWKNKAKKLTGTIGEMQTTDDLETLRKEFETLSELVYLSFKELGVKDLVVYKQYCPMAFNNEGAYWLSSEQEIMNPYFGDMMLHCGKVQEVLRFQ